MSLFGTSPEGSGTLPDALLAETRPPAVSRKSQSSLFADDDDVGKGDGASPWGGLPTPKRSSRGELVKSLLPAKDVPERYIEVYDALLDSHRQGAGVGLAGVRKLLEGSGLDADIQAIILNTVLPDGPESADGHNNGVTRSQVNVLLALIGLAQEEEDITLDGVDERRNNLPVPSLPSMAPKPSTAALHESDSQPAPKPVAEPSIPTTPSRPGARREDTLKFPESDPWSSPALHRGHNHAELPDPASRNTEPSVAKASASDQRPLSRDRNVAGPGAGDAEGRPYDAPRRNPLGRRDSEGWNSFDGSTINAFSNQPEPGLGSEASGVPGVLSSRHDVGSSLARPVNTARPLGNGAEESVTVSLISEKEGMFMFQYRNYQVATARRGAKVVRRYSDFVWLLSCLHKRYPFRQLPLLPPKRVAVNGNHLLSDTSFLEKRRRGLTRFANVLVRHPVLSQDQLVIMFLTVPTELAVWRKQASVSVQEEFTGRALPPELELSLPPNLADTFDAVRAGVRRSLELYSSVCILMDRLARRNEWIAADYRRLSQALQSIADTSETTYAINTDDVSALNAGVRATAGHVTTSQNLLEDEAHAWDDGVIEDLKTQRDALVSLRDVFDRRDRLAKNNIPALERRIENNENKLAALRARPAGTVKPSEREKVEQAIIQDKESIVTQHARGVFIKECIRDELNYFQSSVYRVTRLHQDWSRERVKYAELQAKIWRSLSEELEAMPTGE